MRNKIKKWWLMIIATLILFIFLAFSVDGIQKQFIYNDRALQLTTYYEQLDAVITYRFARYFRLLTSWTYHLKHLSTTGIHNFDDYVSAEKKIWDVEEAYLLDEDGAYISASGGSGTLNLTPKTLEKFKSIGSQQVLRYEEENTRYDLFILSISPGEYNGFNYCAMAMALSPNQMKERMDIGNEVDNSENYLTDKDGNMIMCSVSMGKEQENILEFIEENGIDIPDKYVILRENIKNGKKGVDRVNIKGRMFYVTYMECHTNGLMLVCLTPSDMADASVNNMRMLTDIAIMVLFSIVLGLVVLMFRYIKMQDMLAVSKSANDIKSRFLANMSHDFRTPMNAMAGYISLMKENADDPEKVIEYSVKAEKAHRNMLNMINSVLDLSKIEEGGDEVKREKFSLNKMLTEIRDSIQEDADRKRQELIIKNERVKQDIFIGDEEKLKIVLRNILQNSIKFTDEEGEIMLEISPEDDSAGKKMDLRFEITDNGIGMSDDLIKHIFEPFVKERSNSMVKEHGTGLGLAIAKNMVDMMGGTIEVASVVGEGTVFTLRVTLDIPDKTEKEEMEELSAVIGEAQNAEVQNREETQAFKGMRFLAAEDNEINAEILVEILNMKGAESCDIAKDGVQAVEMFENSSPGYYDMILMDIQMPRMDGYEAASAIRKLTGKGREDAGTIPIMAMSANAFKEDIEKTSASGMDAHIPKPIDQKLFERTVKALKMRGHEANEQQ